jgi:hypothetical protein
MDFGRTAALIRKWQTSAVQIESPYSKISKALRHNKTYNSARELEVLA